MSISKEAQKKLLKKLNYSDADIQALVDSEEEKDVTLDDKVLVFKEDELQTLKSNSYKDGKKAGVEMDVDDVKKELGLDFQGKSVKGLIEAHKKKVLEDAKIEPAEKVKELEAKVTTLQSTVQSQEKLLADKETEVSGVKTKSELYKHIPDFGDRLALGQDDVIQLMQSNGYEFKLENGSLVPYKNGQQLQDKTANPLPAKDVVNAFLTEKKLIIPESVNGGRGAGDNKPPAAAMKLSEIKKTFEAAGKSVLGAEFAEAVAQAAKDNPEFKMSE